MNCLKSIKYYLIMMLPIIIFLTITLINYVLSGLIGMITMTIFNIDSDYCPNKNVIISILYNCIPIGLIIESIIFSIISFICILTYIICKICNIKQNCVLHTSRIIYYEGYEQI